MGLFEKIFPKQEKEKQVDSYFKTLNAYTPAFTNYSGGLYEMELTRAAIHSFANLCSKLKPEIQGSAYKNLEKILQFKPNPYMDTSKFIYRLATILSVNTTAFIIPLYAEDYETIIGYYPILPQRTEVVEVGGEAWLRYTFANGNKAAIELSRVGILTQYQYKDDFFGDGNEALMPTLNLLDIQKQGIEEGIKQSAMIRFMAKLGTVSRPEDIKRERDRFSVDNLSSENLSGVMMFDSRYSEVKQLDSKPFIVDAEQMKIIQENVFNYFGVNQKILQNNFSEDEWNAFYEGKIEPFSLQLSLVMSNMTFTQKELSFGNQIIFTSNRMQYASNKTKLEVSTQLFDRGILSQNQIMDIWNMAHVEDGDKRYIRREYTEVDKLHDGEGDSIASTEDEGVQKSSDTSTDTRTTGEEN